MKDPLSKVIEGLGNIHFVLECDELGCPQGAQEDCQKAIKVIEHYRDQEEQAISRTIDAIAYTKTIQGHEWSGEKEEKIRQELWQTVEKEILRR